MKQYEIKSYEDNTDFKAEWSTYWTNRYKKQFQNKPPMDLIILCFSLVNYQSFINVEKKVWGEFLSWLILAVV